MQKLIQEKLKEIEAQKNVQILFAVESGSRAWGFASHDSDYDVRFVYVRPIEDYLHLEDIRDVIEWQLDDTLDINGWDLKKALQLLHHSNPTLHEWNHSPIVYRTSEEWLSISEVIDQYFMQKAEAYHYLSMAKKNFRTYLKGDTVWLKKYFYVLRPLLACRWILERNSFPPMLFSDLMETYLDESVKPYVLDLLRKKQETSELGTGPRIDALNNFLNNSINQLNNEVKTLPSDGAKPWDNLNSVFLQTLKFV